MSARSHQPLRIASVSVLLACGGGGGDPQALPPPPPQLTLRIVSGSAQVDSIDARLATPLVVEVMRGGQPGVGVAVQFTAIADPPAILLRSSPTATPGPAAVVQTDASGRASVLVEYQNRVGVFNVTLGAAGVSGTVTAQFTVAPGRAHTLTVSPGDTVIYLARSFAPAIAARDRAGNNLTANVTSSVSACAIESAQVLGVNVGRCRISISAPPLLDSLLVSVVPTAKVLAIRNEYDPFGTPRLVSMGLDGTVYTELAQLTYQFPREVLMPLRAPDGRRVTLHSGMGDYSSHLTIFDSSMTARSLTLPGLLHENWGRFSPDGQWIYVSARMAINESFNVWRARPDGTQAENLTQMGPGFGFHSNYADITPDGRTIVYVDQSLYLKAMDVATRTVRPLTNNGASLQAYQLRISPDGRRIAFILPSPRFGVHVINVDGTGYRLVTADIGYDNDVPLDWTADGEWILTRRHEYVDTGNGGGIIFFRTWVLLNAQTGAYVPLPYKLFTPTSMMIDR